MTDDTAHIARAAAALDDPHAALSQHLHGDGDTITAGSRLIASAAETAVSAWRARALAAEAEVERLRAALDATVVFTQMLIDFAEVDPDETSLTFRVMPEGREVATRPLADVMAQARAALKETIHD